MNAEERSAYRLLVGKPEGKRPSGRQRHMWVDNVKMDPGEMGGGGGDMDGIGLARDIDQWRAVMNSVIKFLRRCTTSSFCRRAEFHIVR
jgi:hypothetical protein